MWVDREGENPIHAYSVINPFESRFALPDDVEKEILVQTKLKIFDMHEEEVGGKRKEFRTDTGEIDIFAIWKYGTEYLVIELKKGRASEKVVGQIQTYMGFIKKKLLKITRK